MPLVRMKAAPVKTDGERLGNEFMNGVFFSAHLTRFNHQKNLLESFSETGGADAGCALDAESVK